MNKNLKQGDLIGISYGNYIQKGIFVEFGSANNLRYVVIHKSIPFTLLEENKRPYIAYIIGDHTNRVVKLYLEDFGDIEKVLLKECLDLFPAFLERRNIKPIKKIKSLF